MVADWRDSRMGEALVSEMAARAMLKVWVNIMAAEKYVLRSEVVTCE